VWHEASHQAAVFVVVWAGAAIVTLNAQLLGGRISFFQSVCVLGYSIFPLNVGALLCLVRSGAGARPRRAAYLVGRMSPTRGEESGP